MLTRDRPEAPATVRRMTGEIDMGGIWRALLKRRRAIIIPTLLLTAAAILFVNVVTPRYAGEARVLLESRIPFLNRADRVERDQTTTAAFDPEGVQSQVQVVTSNDLAREAIKRLKLIGNPEFDPSATTMGFLTRILALLGLSRDLTERSVEERVMNAYYEKLSVYPVGRSRVVGIEFSSSDPELAARGADTIADLYLETVTAAKQSLARSAGAWLSSSIDELRQRVKDAEAKVEDFRSRNGLFTAGRETTLPQQQLAEASTQLTQARTQQADAQAKAQFIREMIRNGRVFEISEVANNELVRRLIEQRVTLRAQVALESRTLGAGHPRMKELQAQLADIEAQIRNAAERTVRGMENDARVAGARVAQLTASLDEQKKRSGEVLESDVQLRALEREARTLRDQLESYLSKYRDAIARETENAEPPDARIISRAIVPTRPAFPKKLPIVLLTAFAALIMTSAVAVARDLMGSGEAPPARMVVAADETQDALPIAAPPAANRPAESPPTAADPVIMRRAEEAGAGSYHSILSALSARIGGGHGRGESLRIAIVGADRIGAGDFIVDFAREQAMAGSAILVALSDAIAPADGEAAGCLDVARGDASFAEAIRREQGSKLHVMPRGSGDFAEAARDPDSVAFVIDALGEAYGTLVIDYPFDMASPAPRLLTGDADHVVLLARGASPDAETEALFAKLRTGTGAEPIVVLLEAEAQETRTAA